ncbi:MAG: ferritin [Calditrichia bacterium]
MAHEGLHERFEDLRPHTLDFHRAIISLVEELEAIDWYNQRMDACSDEELKKILKHNRDEEKEHAAMLLEWLRRNDEQFPDHLKKYLFTKESIVNIEK